MQGITLSLHYEILLAIYILEDLLKHKSKSRSKRVLLFTIQIIRDSGGNISSYCWEAVQHFFLTTSKNMCYSLSATHVINKVRDACR